MATSSAVSFVLVTYESHDTIIACLSSIARHTSAPHDIVVVDNSPTPQTVQAVHAFQAEHPGVSLRLLKPESNIGFGRACNLGAREAGGEYLFFLNPDTELLNDASELLTRCLAGDARNVAAGPAVLNSSGEVTRTCRNLPTLWRILLDASGLDRFIGAYKLTRFSHQEQRSVEQIIGAAFFMQRSAFERAGGFDERFFVYFEEVDLCKRLLQNRGLIQFCPEARVQHHAGVSCEAEPVRARMIGMLRESRALYFQKHFGLPTAFAMKGLNRVEGLVKAAVFGILGWLTRRPSYREKRNGFWRVATAHPSERLGKEPFRVLAFTVKPEDSADTRYRILQFQPAAARAGVEILDRSLMGPTYFTWQLHNEQTLLRVLLYPFLLLRRLLQILLLAPRVDAVWVSREMNPLGPPIFETLLARRAKRLVFDIDDALHLPDEKGSRPLSRLLRDHDKFGRVASLYETVVCGNKELALYYQAYVPRVQVIPTVIDPERYATVETTPTLVPRIGWIGTPLNRQHVEILKPVFEHLALERQFELVFVGLNEELNWQVPHVRYMQWKLQDELQFFAHFDIGVMPLRDTPFARGKCAFKLIQYMACGLPVVASAVGANCEVVQNGVNGYLAENDLEWSVALRSLIDDPALRTRMGKEGQRLVQQVYSVSAVWPKYCEILTGAAR